MGKGVPYGLGGLWEQADNQKTAARAAKQYLKRLDIIFLSKIKRLVVKQGVGFKTNGSTLSATK